MKHVDHLMRVTQSASEPERVGRLGAEIYVLT